MLECKGSTRMAISKGADIQNHIFKNDKLFSINYSFLEVFMRDYRLYFVGFKINFMIFGYLVPNFQK